MARWGFRGLSVAMFAVCAERAWAHSAAPRINPLFTPLSVMVAALWLTALTALYGYHARQRRAHAASGAQEPYRPRRMTATLIGLALLLAVSGLGLRAIRHEPPDGESRLRGSPEEALDALSVRLSRTPESERVGLLLKLSSDPSPGLRFAAADQLGDFRGPVVIEALEQVYSRDSFALARERAMEVLPVVDRARGMRLLAKALRDPDTTLREAAALQLSGLMRQRSDARDQSFVPALMQALEDPSPIVSAAAINILGKLTGQRWRVKSRSTKEEQKSVLETCRAWWSKHRLEWPASPADGPPVEVRRDASPDFALTDLDGNAISRDGQKGRVTLLNFWGTWCAPCRSELPDLVAVSRAYREQPVDVIGIAVSERDGPEGLRRWCDGNGIHYRHALATHEVQDAFGRIEAVPVTILIDKKSHIRNRWDGPRDAATFRAAIDRLLAE